ncbi:ANTAR domain-containing protein [Streptomyces sp. NPDC007100]|uniref:ANTAR domain-containing protein n=1 Tax=unclassified Streptomyces TaxID=2593676 RepID=UPI0033D18B69
MPEPAPGVPRTDVLAHGDRMRVAVRGELDLDACRRIERDLYDVLSRSARGVELHLDGVPFCDCSGLNMLLRLRLRALVQNKTVVIRTGSRAVERLLDLTGARELLMYPTPDGPDAPSAAAPSRSSHEDTHQEDGRDHDRNHHRDLPAEVAQLRRAMQTRPAIDLARGILMATFGLNPEEAWSVLVTASQNTNTKLHLLAQDLVDGVQGTVLPEPVKKQLAAAVAKAKAAPAATRQADG